MHCVGNSHATNNQAYLYKGYTYTANFTGSKMNRSLWPSDFSLETGARGEWATECRSIASSQTDVSAHTDQQTLPHMLTGSGEAQQCDNAAVLGWRETAEGSELGRDGEKMRR